MKAIIILFLVLYLTTTQAISVTNCLSSDTSGKCTSCQTSFILVTGTCQCPANTIFFNGQCLKVVDPSTVPNLIVPQDMYKILSDINVFLALQAFIKQINSNPSGFLQTYPVSTISTLTNNQFLPIQTPTLTTTTTSVITTPVAANPSSSSNTASTASTSSIYPGLSLTTTNTLNSPSTPSTLPPIFVPTLPLVSLTNQQSDSQSFKDQNCQDKGTACLKCYKGFYTDSISGLCKATNPLCQNVTTDNQCTSCYLGYILVNGNCLQGSDPRVNCQSISNGICVKCYSSYFLNTTLNLCIKTNSSCKSFNPDMSCSECFTGYFNINSKCILPSQLLFQNVQQYSPSILKDNFCANFSDNGSCIVCQTRYYINAKGLCELVDPFCSNYTSNGACSLCYIGYKIRSKACVQLNSKIPATAEDLLANIICPYRYVGAKGDCLQVSDLCYSWDSITGACTWCWPGYSVQNGACVIMN